MAKKKTEEKKDSPSPKKTAKVKKVDVNIEKYSISELLEKNKIKPLYAVMFLEYYGLEEEFKKEFENNECVVKFSQGEFDDMYERMIRREI